MDDEIAIKVHFYKQISEDDDEVILGASPPTLPTRGGQWSFSSLLPPRGVRPPGSRTSAESDGRLFRPMEKQHVYLAFENHLASQVKLFLSHER